MLRGSKKGSMTMTVKTDFGYSDVHLTSENSLVIPLYA